MRRSSRRKPDSARSMRPRSPPPTSRAMRRASTTRSPTGSARRVLEQVERLVEPAGRAGSRGRTARTGRADLRVRAPPAGPALRAATARRAPPRRGCRRRRATARRARGAGAARGRAARRWAAPRPCSPNTTPMARTPEMAVMHEACQHEGTGAQPDEAARRHVVEPGPGQQAGRPSPRSRGSGRQLGSANVQRTRTSPTPAMQADQGAHRPDPVGRRRPDRGRRPGRCRPSRRPHGGRACRCPGRVRPSRRVKTGSLSIMPFSTRPVTATTSRTRRAPVARRTRCGRPGRPTTRRWARRIRRRCSRRPAAAACTS